LELELDMNDHSIRSDLPPEKESIQAKCFHPTEVFVEFKKEEIEQSIPDRFERIVQLYPHRLAVKAGDRSLTYDALNRAANRIARAILAKRGTGSEPIALLFEHGIDAITAIFGVLKAGKFYVALDSSFPPERINYILKDSEAPLILTNSRNWSLCEKLTSDTRALLNIDECVDSFSYENLGLTVSLDDFARLRYTSGSTGQPKGAVKAHRHTARSADEIRIFLDDRLSLVHSVSFGSSSDHLFSSLLNGASLFPFDIKSEGILRLASWLREEQITICHLPPAVFRQLADVLSGHGKLPSLRIIRLSGAPITRLDFDLYKKISSPGTFLKIGMGATEAGRICSAVLDQTFSFPQEGTAAGYPRRGKQILLLDENGHEVGPNQPGEIAVKGRGLASGYWKNKDRVNAKFVSDPGGGDERIYLTGDYGRMLPDGFLIHLGRKDFMVKIRGYRVEIVEIEKALQAHPRVRDAGVVAWDREPGEKYLVAYVVPRKDPAPAVDDLRGFLKEKLPDYMMPSVFMFLESLPLTNGKLDRTALPLPDSKRPDLQLSYVPPRNPAEEKLTQIWEEILDIRPIGVHDDFFALGGHSLLGTRVILRLAEVFHKELPLRSLFDAPTIAGLADLIQEAPRKEQSSRTLDLHPTPRARDLPLSFSQERLWFLDQLEPGSRAYNLPGAFRLKGPLQVDCLERSLNEIVKRHEVLRTTFSTLEGRPVQRILPSLALDLPVVNLRELSESEREAKAQRLAKEETHKPFDLAHGPLMRAMLLRLDDEDHVILLSMHHIVADGWSMGVLLQELSALYEAFSKREPSPLPELPIQYADYARWQREWFQGEVLKTQLAYWTKRLDGASTLQLPTDRPRLPAQSFCGARRSFVFSETLLNGLKRLSNQYGVTLFMTLLGAYQTLLHRYTGEDDIAIGSPIAGRNHSQVEGLIGPFFNVLVLRTNLSGNPTFRDLLVRVRETCLDAYDHADLSFDKLVEELHPRRDLSHNPLFQATFALRNTPTLLLELPGLTAQDFEIGSGIARVDLHLFFVVESETTLRGWLSYNTDLFDASTINRMAGHFQMIVEAMVANPNQRIATLSILTEAERHQLLVEWNSTEKDYPHNKCIHQLFEEQVERTPDAVAVVFEEQELTYDELNARANQLSRYLRKHGVAPDVPVGILMERSMDMVVALLGILKAGGAYVPLDPGYPKDRLAFMLEDSQVAVLLTQQQLAENLPYHDAHIVYLDRERIEIVSESDDSVICEVNPTNLAYVLYTSGSTGTPKGIAIEHHGPAALLSWAQAVFAPEDLAGVLASTSVCFDLSVFELFAPLISGGKVILAENILVFPRLPAAADVTLVNTVPSAIDELLRTNTIPSSVRTIALAGEPLKTRLVQQIYGSTSVKQVYDLYGPSEGTTYSTCALRTSDGPETIGRPIANTQIYILDTDLQPVPVGVPGEVHISGKGLARGYLNRSELTAEKFTPNPFSKEPGARLYRTGDLARYLPDGNIEFRGRTDHQVKVFGFRIELEETETVLGQHPAVAATVVMAREDAPGGKRLVAYVVLNEDQAATVSELRTFLQAKLPNYMIPSAFVLLDSLPLTPNGKVDRGALPPPNQTRPELERSFLAPRTPSEQLLTAIWAQILELDKIGVHDNFFDLGGHSLLATQIVSRIRETLQIELPLRRLFEKPTIAELAELISEERCRKMDSADMSGILTELESMSDEAAQKSMTEGFVDHTES
jgi:amino acid adenylation domain-containing protein